MDEWSVYAPYILNPSALLTAHILVLLVLEDAIGPRDQRGLREREASIVRTR